MCCSSSTDVSDSTKTRQSDYGNSSAIYWPGGRWPFHLQELHKKYGDVVRYAPNDLDFATPQSFQDVHGHVKQGKQTFCKGEFYGSGDSGSLSIVSARDPEKHREIRKLLSHAFSAKALRLQTDVVIQYVNMFIAQLKRLGNTPEGVIAEEVSSLIQLIRDAVLTGEVLQLAHLRHYWRPSLRGVLRRRRERKTAPLGDNYQIVYPCPYLSRPVSACAIL